MDGFTLLLLSLGLYFCTGRTPARDLAAGFFFAAAIAFKAYPLLVVLPLIAMRRWRLLAALSGAMACFILASPGLWAEWVQWMDEDRYRLFRVEENGSLANTFLYIGDFFGYGKAFRSAAPYVWGLALLAMFRLDWKSKPLGGKSSGQEALAALVLYVPFMLAFPKLAYHYELVCVLVMLPAVSHLWTNAMDARERGLLLLITIGLILTQFQAYAVERLVVEFWSLDRCLGRLPQSGACLPQWIPGFGLFLVMAGALALKALRRQPA